MKHTPPLPAEASAGGKARKPQKNTFQKIAAVPHSVWTVMFIVAPMLFVLYFAALPRAMGGRTFGQAILKLRTMDEHAIKTASFMQLLGRNVLLYAVEPFAIFIGVQFVGVFAVILFAEHVELWLRIVGGAVSLAVPLGVLWFFLYVQREWGTFPHGHYSHTIVIADNSSAGDETSRGRER